MLVTCALAISLSFPYLVFSMFFAHSLPSVINGRPSIVALTFNSNSSLRYKSLVIGNTCASAESISILKWLQNRGHYVCVPLNFVITSLGSFNCSLLFLVYILPIFLYLHLVLEFLFQLRVFKLHFFCYSISAARSSSFFFPTSPSNFVFQRRISSSFLLHILILLLSP